MEFGKRGFNPYESGRPILDPHRFYGREAIIRRILSIIHQNDVLIHGERRIGKTSLLYQLAHRLRKMEDPEYRFIPVYIDLEGTAQEDFFHVLMEEIAASVREGVELPKLLYEERSSASYSHRDFLRDLRSILRVLQAEEKKRVRLVLLMDEVDVMNGYDQLVQQQFRRILMKTFAQDLGIVASGVHVFKEWSREESPFRNLFVEIHLGPLEDEEEARRLITEPAKGVYEFDEEAIKLILKYSERKPWRIQRICLEVVNRLLAEKRTKVTPQDVEAVYPQVKATEEELAAMEMRYPMPVPAAVPVKEGREKYRTISEEGEDA